jgi:hypothetical protein
MIALQIMLSVYGIVIVIAVAYALVWPRLQTWLIRRGASDAEWLSLGDEPPGFKAYRDALKKKSP